VTLAATTAYESWFLAACAAGTVALLLILIARVRLHPALALCIAALTLGVASVVLAPMAGHIGVRLELLVLATGTGSLILSHVNDPGFWMIQSFFKLELKETLSTWTCWKQCCR
jgi:H+/gluconate symporter-like permease